MKGLVRRFSKSPINVNLKDELLNDKKVEGYIELYDRELVIKISSIVVNFKEQITSAVKANWPRKEVYFEFTDNILKEECYRYSFKSTLLLYNEDRDNDILDSPWI